MLKLYKIVSFIIYMSHDNFLDHHLEIGLNKQTFHSNYLDLI